MDWKNRIVKTGNEDPGQLLANEWNWRIHPQSQQDSLKAALDEIGWIQDIVINMRKSELWGKDRGIPTVVDGHARIKLALRYDQKVVPVKYVDLTPVEEKKMLIALDRITGMAEEDSTMLLDLIRSLDNEGEIPTIDDMKVADIMSRVGSSGKDQFGNFGDGALCDLDFEVPVTALRIIITFDTVEQMDELLRRLGYEDAIDRTRVVYRYSDVSKNSK